MQKLKQAPPPYLAHVFEFEYVLQVHCQHELSSEVLYIFLWLSFLELQQEHPPTSAGVERLIIL